MGSEAALAEISRRKPILKNRVAPEVEATVVELAIEEPVGGEVRVANELAKEKSTSRPPPYGASGSGTISRR